MNPLATAGQGAESPLLNDRDARGVHTLTLNTPKRFNVLGETMLGALEAVNGMLLFGLTTAFLFAMIQRVLPPAKR